MKGRPWLLLVLALALGGTVALLRSPTPSSAPDASRRAPLVLTAHPTTSGPTHEAATHVATTLEPSTTAASLATDLSKLAAPVLGPTLREQDRRALEADLVAIARTKPRGHDLVRLRVDLERLLRDQPALAPAVARAFDRTDDRLTLFAFSRALVLALGDPEVRTTLEADARSSPVEARREIALRALGGTGDPALVALETATVASATDPDSVRAAAADGLAKDWDHLAEADASRVRAAARALAATPERTLEARESALHLLATAGPGACDERLAREILADPGAPVRVALAAARVALTAGEERGDVARLLALHASGPQDPCARAAARLAGTDHPQSDRGGDRD